MLATRCLAMDYSGFQASCHNMINSYRDLFAIPEGKRPLRRTGYRWADNINTCINEIGWESGNWVTLSQTRVMTR
jgi:hypothetical protein